VQEQLRSLRGELTNQAELKELGSPEGGADAQEPQSSAPEGGASEKQDAPMESYVIEPLVQRRAVGVSPALLIGSLVILGIPFGIWGLALGAPLAAVLRVLVQRLWVEDALGDPDRAGDGSETEAPAPG